MFACGIVKHLDVVEHVLLSFDAVVAESSVTVSLALEHVEGTLGNNVVVTVAEPDHCVLKIMGTQKRSPIDAGAQYLSITYTELLAEAKIAPSVGSVGGSSDNAMAETNNGLFKAEVIHRRGTWRSFEALEYATLEWIDWFNNRRLLEPIRNIPPAEAEENSYAALERVDMAA